MSDTVAIPLLTEADVEELESRLLASPQMPIRYLHTFAPGIYVREAHVPAGMVGIGHEHTTSNVNVVLKGRLKIVAGDKVVEMAAPCVFVADPGVRKVAYFLEDTVWLNVLHNPTNETDPEKLEDLFVVKSDTFLRHVAQTSLTEENP